MTPVSSRSCFRFPLFTVPPFRRYLALLLFFSLFLGLSGHAHGREIRVGVYPNNPLIFEEARGQYQGLTIDFLRYVAKKEKWNILFVPGSWSECLQRLEQGRIDLQVAIAVSESRKRLFSFTEKTLLVNWGVLYGRPNSGIESFIALNGKRVAVLENDIHARVFQELVGRFNLNLELVKVKSYDAVLQMVEQGDADGGVVNRLYAAHEADRFQVQQTPIVFNPIEIRFAAPKGENSDLLLTLDKHLQQLQEDKTSVYYQSLARWVGQEGGSRLPFWIKPFLLILCGLLGVVLAIAIFLKRREQLRTRELRESEEQYRLLFENAAVGVSISDRAGRGYVMNHAMEEITGYSVEDLGEVNASQFYHNHEDRDHFLALLQEKGQVDNFEVRLKRKNGEIYWASLSSKPVTYGGDEAIQNIVVDITERKEAEEALQVTQKAIDNAAISVVWIDRQGRYIYANKRIAQTTGYSREALLHMHVWDIDPVMPQEKWPEHWRIVQEKGSLEGEMIHRRKDGSEFPVSVTSYFLSYGGREYVCGFAKDISEQRQAEEKQAQLEEQYRQAQKMEAMGTLAGGIAHDFNNILSGIIGCAELAKGTNPAGGVKDAELDEIIQLSGRAGDLVKQILTFSRKKEQEKIRLQPHQIVREVMKMLRSTIPTSVEIVEDIGVDSGTILGDPTNIHQIIMNLCTNGLQSLKEEKGRLTVRLYREEVDRSRLEGKSELEPGPYVVLAVTDSGCGMDPDTRERIFEPYFSTKEIGEGTGLGLSVVHGIVENSGGFIEVDSKLGKGTTLSVYLPAVEADGDSSVSVQAEQKRSSAARARILVVDDEELIVRVNTKRLEARGYQVVSASDPRAALKIFRDQAEAIDLLITDQTMPGLTGVELARAALKIKPELPVILCTGHSDILSEDKALTMGISRYVPKPLKEDELLDVVEELLAKGKGKSLFL